MDKIKWQHPTGNTPKTVALVALGQSRDVYAGAWLQNDLSEAVTTCDEIWTLNRGVNVFNHDLLFVMDHIQGEADKFPRYGASLWKHNKPIITSDNSDGWPNHVYRYPLNEIWDWLRKNIQPQHSNWWHNSLAYIVVYAAFIGVKELRVFGADYADHKNGAVEDGHVNVAYWVGVMERAGLVCMAPEQSGFLGINQRGFVYGYKDNPLVIPANRARFRAMTGQGGTEETTALLSGERQVAETLEEIQPDHRYRYAFAASKVHGMVIDCGSGIGYGSLIMAQQPAVDTIIALEHSRESIDYAESHYDHKKIYYSQEELDGRCLHERYRTGYAANWAVAFELIEHLHDPKPLLQSLPADRLLISVPNENVVPYSPETAPFHQRHYTPFQLQELLTETGWKAVKTWGQHGPMSDVVEFDENCRTIIVEAERWRDSSNTSNIDGDS
ncbi:MAG: hypothetical protein IPK79_14550 [Vampirovibrionales bacterium]|nr:hypothetical protein [Vampirovibrionales bacterium]